MNHKVAVIICWYGPFPEYFPLFLKSCACNPGFDFLIFTDTAFDGEYPKNVKPFIRSFGSMKSMFEERLGFAVSLEQPFRFCDFRPAFGVLFADYLEGYDFWGHCDIDQIFGDIKSVINDEILSQYERVLFQGHLSLYKNNAKMNRLFEQDGAIYPYKRVFTTGENYAFDEFTGILKICEKQGIKLLRCKCFVDCDVAYSRYRFVNDERDTAYQVFYWENGRLYRAYLEDGTVRTDEFIYLHFQKKHPANRIKDAGCASFYLLPKEFREKQPGVPDAQTVKELSGYHGEEAEQAEKKAYIKKKLRQFAACSLKQKNVWLKQKLRG